MDAFLAKYGTRGPFAPGTTESINKGKLVPDDKNHKYVNSIWTCYGRVLLANLDQPFTFPTKPGERPSTPKYGIRMLLNPAGCGELFEAGYALAAAATASGENMGPLTLGPKTYSFEERWKLPANQGGLNWPLLEGDAKLALEPTTTPDFYRGMFYLNAGMYPTTTKGVPQRPAIYDGSGNKCDPNVIYPGCYATIQITMSWFKNQIAGIRVDLEAVQFAFDGERIAVGNAGAAPASIHMAHPDFGPPIVHQPSFAPPAQQGFQAPAQVGFQAPPAWQQPPAQQPAAPVMQNYAPQMQAPAAPSAPPGWVQNPDGSWAQVAAQQPAMPQNSAGAPPGYIPGFSR